ncbi:MAG: tRNA 2-thiouridine(34) synthase MnmA, partial [Candidatus Parcubacteria bacterium]|nr:tRNA 2-thiouridine(34) synthase MnmA [Candidatus Parcubacteria bacterium]
MKQQTVFVGLSGGVDSAVSAVLLKEQGYEVVGVFIKTWHPDFLVCNEEEERMDAMRVSAFLGISFLTFDFEDVYKKEVADYMIAEYKMGRTPNPDVMCNKEVKFGAFLKKSLAMGADFVATGHYAQNFPSSLTRGRLGGGSLKFTSPQPSPYQGEGEIHHLQKGLDPLKDQSYFLWTLKQEQLKHILFPVGNLKKTEVRKLAKKFNLPVAEKKDSQGICFLGAVDLKEFLKHYIKEKKGKVLNGKKEVIGYHDGVVFYTLGERHGFTITKKGPNDGRYYVVDKDIK